jgi:hypothetical protein
MSVKLAICLVLVLALVGLGASAIAQQRGPPPPAPPFLVVVNVRSETTSVERGFLEDAFLKKITTWPSGEVIRPVDLPGDSPVRRAFTRTVLNRSVEAVKGYWQQRIFSGRDVPPPELVGDDEIVKFVVTHEGGVGYVSGSAHVDGCRVVGVR